MTNAELLAKIKAEIERLKEEAYNSILPDEPKYRTHYKVGKKELCEELLSFLSTLESEKPMNQDGLEEEINRYLEPIHAADIQFEPFTQMTKCARHFANWQKEQYHFFNEAWADKMQYQLDRNYENGKQAMREQMMKEAVEADVNVYGDIVAGKKWAEFVVEMPTNNLGNKVRVIVLPNTDEQ